MNKSKIEGLAIPAGAKRSSFKGLTAILLGFLLGGFLLLSSAMSAWAYDLPSATCPTNLNSCTANDLVTTVVAAEPLSGDTCTGYDDTVQLQFTLLFHSTANQRYDLGIFVSQDGGTIPDPSSAPDPAQYCVGAAPPVGEGENPYFLNLDGDTCGDIDGDDIMWTVVAEVSCSTIDENGNLKVPSCRVWEQNQGGVCTTIEEAGTGSKCDCTDLDFTGLLDPCVTAFCGDDNVCTSDTCENVGGEAVCHNDPVAAGTSCGDSSDSECTNPDTCDGSGTCQPNNEASTTTCGDDGNQCVNQDYCDGEGGCTDNGFVAADTACGDPSDTECTNPDTCDGSGTCQPNNEASTTTCGDDGNQCVNQDYCDGEGGCTDNGFVAADTACGDPSDTECSNPDTCDGSGTCQPNNEASTTTCGDDGTECVEQDYCDGEGGCTDNGFVAADTACGDSSDTECTNPDTCDGSGTCQPNNEASTTTCGDDGTECVEQDYCDGEGGCTDNGFVAADTACGDSSDTECTNPDTCDGSGTCQPNNEASTTTCGDDGTECVEQDYCDGEGGCTDNGFVAADTACGDSSDTECTNPDTCDGSGTCQPNNEASTATCGDDGTECVEQDYCDGEGGCTDKGFVAADTACGDSSDTECTNPDTCDGSGTCQPNNEASTATCGDDGTECVEQDYCDGEGGCTDNGFVAADTACGDSSDTECTNPDTCDGSGTCQPNNEASTTTCGDDGTECVEQDYCDGEGGCTDKGFVDAGSSCGDSSSGECDGPDTCDGSGSCQNNNVADGTFCGSDGTDCIIQDVCVKGDCQDNGFEPPDTPCDDGNECTSGTGVSEGPDLCDGQGVCTSQNLPWGSPCGDDSVTACTDADNCDGDGNCLFNNKECGSATNSSLCEYDMEPTQGDCSVDGAPCIFDQGCVDLGGISCTAAEECLDAEGNYLGDCSPDTACLGDCEQSDQFRLIFTPDVQNWLSYKLNGSNPGQTYYNMMYDTTAAAAANASVTLTVTIPYPYVTVGGNPLHVYDAATVGSNGYGCLEPGQGISNARVIITLDDWINGTQNGDNNLNCDQVVGPGGSGNCTFQFTVPANKLPDSNMLYANIHLDYGLKGNSVDANPYDFLEDRYDRHAYISPWGSSDALVDGDSDDGDLALADCQAYWFQHTDEPGVPAKLFEDQLQNLNVFKKIAGTFGRVYCADDDTGFAGYELKLVHPVYGTVQESTTDGEGYYALNFRHKGRPTYYTVEVYDGSENLVESEVIELQGNGWLDLRFSAMDCGSDPVWSSTFTYGSGRNKNNK